MSTPCEEWPMCICRICAHDCLCESCKDLFKRTEYHALAVSVCSKFELRRTEGGATSDGTLQQSYATTGDA